MPASPVHIGVRRFATRTLFAGVSGNRRPQAVRQIDMALKPIILTILMFGVSRGLGVTSELSEKSQASANELVRKIVANEIKAETEDHSHWAFQLQTEEAGRRELDEVVETKDGNLQRPVCVNGQPITAKQKEQANLHIQKFVHNPEALRKSLRDESEDTTRSQNMLKLLPNAFNFSYEERGSGDLVKLKFTPNPRFRPPSREALVFHAMEGEITVNDRQQRLAEILGHLIHEVKFGGGLLGHLDKGGQFHVRQEQVSPGFWELTVLNVQMKGKVLFFKTIGVRQKIIRSGFRRVSDDLPLAQAAEILRESAMTATDSCK